jgi:hypothetical protein
LTTRVPPTALALLESALESSTVSASIAVREYARLLWATFEEKLAVTTRYRTRIERPLTAPAEIRTEGRLVRSFVNRGRWLLDVATEIRDESGAALATNQTRLLVIPPTPPSSGSASSRSEPSGPLRGDILAERLTRERIVALEEATASIWTEHAVDNIHTRRDAARATGISEQRFASGMLTTGLIMKWLESGDRNWFTRYEIDIRFRAPAAEGALLEIGAPAETDTRAPEAGCRQVACSSEGGLVAVASLIPREAGVEAS